MNRCACICFVCFLAALLFGCDTNEPTLLLADIPSGISPDAARRSLNVAADNWTVIEDSHLPPGDKRPRSDVLIVEVRAFTHCGVTGVLGLQFYNDRLTATLFYPEDLPAYLHGLAAKGIHFEPPHSQADVRAQAREVRLAPRTRIWLYRDYKDRDYIGWEDVKLIGEQNRWIDRHS